MLTLTERHIKLVDSHGDELMIELHSGGSAVFAINGEAVLASRDEFRKMHNFLSKFVKPEPVEPFENIGSLHA